MIETELDEAFVAVQIGDPGTPERTRADDITDYVISPVAKEFDLRVVRSDREATPGRITHQIIRSLLEARVVIADVTGKNPNVYYELAVAHSFTRPVIMLVDSPDNIAFDTKDERVIALGSYDGRLPAARADDAQSDLRKTLSIVLQEDYEPTSLVSEVGGIRSLDQLAPSDPVAAELQSIRDTLEELTDNLPRLMSNQDSDLHALVAALTESAESGLLHPAVLSRIHGPTTSRFLDRWAQETVVTAERTFSSAGLLRRRSWPATEED